MNRNKTYRKRNVIVKINKKQEKKNLILEKHHQNKTVRFKRPLLKIEQTFTKLEKAKHVDKQTTLIQQKIMLNKKFLEGYHSLIFKNDQFKKINPLLINRTSKEDLCYEYTHESINIWFVPETTALCFNLDKHVKTIKKQNLEAATRNLKEEFKKSYEKYLTASVKEQIESNLGDGEIVSCEVSTDQRGYIKTACSLPNLPHKKRIDLLSLIDSHQSVVVGAMRDENEAFTEVPLLLLEHLLSTLEQDNSRCADDIPESNVQFKRNPIRMICSTPHFLTAQLAVDKMRKQLNDTEYSLVELNVGFKRKRNGDTFPPLLFCTNEQLVHSLLDNFALSRVSHVILDRAQHRDDMFDFILVYMRQYLLPKRPDLKLIILSSPIFMDILSKHFQLPFIKLPSTIKPSPVYYLEHILQETNFSPSSESDEYGNMKIIEKVFTKDYHEKLQKHVNLLRLRGTYHANVMDNMLNPELEGVHIGLIISLLKKLSTSEGNRVILVFLPNDLAIAKLFAALMASMDSSLGFRLEIIKYHSKITRKSSRHLIDGKTVIILATDNLEAVDSIDNVSDIVDCGCYEKLDFLAHFNISTSELEWTTKQIQLDRKSWCKKRSTCKFYSLTSSVRATQLRGLCFSYLGRIRPDYLAYLITRFNIPDVAAFLEHLDIKPQHRSIHLALKRLQILNMLDSKKERLSPVGFSLSSLLLPAHLARMAVLGCVFSCLDPVLSIIAVLLYHDPFDETSSESTSLLKAKCAGGSLSDHMVWVRVLALYEDLVRTKQPKASIKSQCQSFGVLYDSIVLLGKVKKHLLYKLERAGYVRQGVNHDVNALCESLVEAVVYAGLYPNVAVMRSPTKIVITNILKVTIHPSSVYHSNVLSTPTPSGSQQLESTKVKSKQAISTKQSSRTFLSYSQCYGTDMGAPSEQIYIRDVTPVSSMVVILFSHDFYIPTRKAFKFTLNDKGYHFYCQDAYVASFIERLRASLTEIIENTIVNHSVVDWTTNSAEVQILRCALELIQNKNNECITNTLERRHIKALKHNH